MQESLERALRIAVQFLEQRGKLDQTYIWDWLAQFAEALDDPSLINKYRQLQEKVERLD